MKRTLPTLALLWGAGISGASAQTLLLQGSDTLGDMINDSVNGILALCPEADAALDFLGGGSSNTENAMIGNTQEVGPMTRFLTASACASDPSPFSGCYRHSFESVSVGAAQSEAENCDAVRWSGDMALPSGGVYTFQSWRTVLRIVYGGQVDQPAELVNYDPCTFVSPIRSTIASKNCASEVRTTLVSTWGNMFAQADGSTCVNGSCTALQHAFRRDDVSSTTDLFLELLALPKVGTGANAPFCNGTETQDNDPIRRQCSGNGFANGEQVCKPANPASPTTTSQGLGLVLPVLIPQSSVTNPYVTSAVEPFCAPNALGGSLYGDVAMPIGTTVCPNGAAQIAGTCKWPKRAAAQGGGFDCLAMANDRPAGTPSTFDGRSYNLILRNAAGVIQNFQRGNTTTGISNRPMTSAYYRIHQTRAISGSTLPPSSGCTLSDPSQQMGCLLEASPCSIGYSHGTALVDRTTGLAYPNRKGLGLRSVVPGSSLAILPTKTNVRLLVQPSGASCTPDATVPGGFDDRYPLAHSLYLCTVNGIPGIAGATAWMYTASQTPSQLQSQAAFAACFANREIVDRAATAAEFVTIDDDGTAPVPFVTCADMGS